MSMKRIIFTLTTGRSGTALLTELLRPLPQVHAEHEPKPLFSDAFVYLKTRHNFNVKEFCKIKLNAIDQLLEENNKSTYIETCHSFGKGFIEPMLELNSDIEIIILHRDPIQVALSMYRLDDIPGRTKTGIHWYLMSDCNLSLTKLADYLHNYSDFQLCYWYTQEILCRSNQLLHTHPDNIACLIDFRELLCYEYFRNILLKLHLTIPKSYPIIYKSIISNKINEKLYRKHNLPLPSDYQAQIDQVNSDLIVK
ncbi:MAG: hypothetical protein ACFFDY_01110 [Candidatus Thorarchaeota archaeon]